MLLEAGIWIGISTLIHYAWFRKKTEREKIDLVFKNIKYGFQDQLPYYFKTIKSDTCNTYIYHLPYGLIDDPKLEIILQKTLNRPVKIELKNQLFIKVYHEDLNSKYNYKFIKLDNWQLPIGYSLGEELIYHDFDKIPHMTVAGATRWGKTVFMKSLMTHFIENHPNDVEFFILDLKGGLSFHRYANIKQVKVVASNYKESASALQMVEQEIKQTMQQFKSNYQENILDTKINKRKFIIIDEAGELVPNNSMSDEDKFNAKICQRIMSHIVRVSGGLGYRMIFGTQYPTAKIMDNQIKANSSAKISFKLETSTQSNVAIDQDGAEKLEYPGRAIYKTVHEHVVQTFFINSDEMWRRLRRYEVNDSARTKKDQRREDIVTFG
ncbi:hypothetical protein F9U64_05320 [Gracilibacillus oryzae]|uniref:FtsK domain-containing protein n=1 Tax=Gracilibacillus oryzae TaxID=1672701 RepID=A0A7C8KRP2_9BACI|nr:FtsK/SpoIIIE domain-containing protein [Gracilibacillus oryzae]KAB8138421.1 hypothetical protein F9U64_05320 [Gracilibacillus oryzae]